MQLKRFQAQARGFRGRLFQRKGSLVYGSAAGWVDLLGGYTAHIAGPALGFPTEHTAFVALQRDPEPVLRVQRLGEEVYAELALDPFTVDGWPLGYPEARSLLANQSEDVRRVAGLWLALMHEEFVRPAGGARVLLGVHDGPGASESVAVALAAALCVAFEVRLARRELGLCAAVGLREIAGEGGHRLGALVAALGTPGELLVIDGPRCGLFGLRLPEGAAVHIAEPGLRPLEPIAVPSSLVEEETLRARMALALLRGANGPQRDENIALVNTLMAQSQAALVAQGVVQAGSGPGRASAAGGRVVVGSSPG
jgi:hypothetical protein